LKKKEEILTMQKILTEKDEKRDFLFKQILGKRLADHPEVLAEII
jgi:hypothetical protein